MGGGTWVGNMGGGHMGGGHMGGEHMGGGTYMGGEHGWYATTHMYMYTIPCIQL